jgi:Tubulin/FtsZ family, GTPase domain
MIFISTGQCGNQISYQILNTLSTHSHGDSSQLFYTTESNRRIARAVCLDTEPKVVNECTQLTHSKHSTWTYDNKSTLYRHGGAGNNWALGYRMFENEFQVLGLNAIQSQLESLMEPATFVSIHSIGGGTGSGLGARCTELLAEEYPTIPRINIVIAPFEFGEVVVQYLNTLLCLSHISQYSDGILLLENEIIFNQCKLDKCIEKPILDDVNRCIANSIVPLILPSTKEDSSGSQSHSKAGHYYPLSQQLLSCTHPLYKFISLYTAPLTSDASIAYTNNEWQALVKNINRYAYQRLILYLH